MLESVNGVGLLDDRDLGEFAEGLADGVFGADGTRLAVGKLMSGEIENRFGFVRTPRA